MMGGLCVVAHAFLHSRYSIVCVCVCVCVCACVCMALYLCILKMIWTAACTYMYRIVASTMHMSRAYSAIC